MNTGQRIAILVAAVVILALGFVLARGSDDEGAGRSAGTTAATVAPGSTSATEPTGGAQAPTETTIDEPAAPAPRVETVRIASGQPATGKPRTLKFRSGDTVRLTFRSDAASEVHIHGYDKTVEVPAGGSAKTRFKANAEGIFEVEDHHSGALLARLEVRP